LANLFLDEGTKVGGGIIVELNLGVAREAGQGDVGDLHAGVETVEIAANDLVEGNQYLLSGLEIGLHRNPLLQVCGYLHAREHRFLPDYIAQAEDQGGRQI
jgi:hypothetical protein